MHTTMLEANTLQDTQPAFSRKQAVVWLLLELGVLTLLYTTWQDKLSWRHWIILIFVTILSFVPAIQQRVANILDALRHPSPRAFRWASVGIFFGSLGYFYLNAKIVGSDFIPKIHDELSYLVQIQQVARGHFWMPGHALPQFFDSFYIISTDRAYASMYFPGLAMLFAPLVWLHLPILLGPMLVMAGIFAMVYRLIAELVDGAAAALAVVMLLGINRFPMHSLMVFSQTPLLLFGLLMFWAWLRWRTSFQWRYAAAIGFFAGWAAVTRPIDAIIFALPVGVGMLLDLRGRRQPLRTWVVSFAFVVLLAAPFLGIQAAMNKAITGRVTQFPHDYYVARDFPQAAYGFFTLDRSLRPVSTLPQKVDFHDGWATDAILKHRVDTLWATWKGNRLRYIWKATVPQPLLVVLIPVGLLALRDRRRWVLFATLPLFVLAYIPYTFFCEHYPLVVAPAGLMLLFLGKTATERTFPTLRPWLVAHLTLVMVTIALCSMAAFNQEIRGESGTTPLWRILNKKIDALPGPSVVLCHFDLRIHKADKEPCYNTDVAFPDDARVVRAQDLGSQENKRLFKYYADEYRAGRQPNRNFYVYDRPADEGDETYKLRYLGMATELAD